MSAAPATTEPERTRVGPDRKPTVCQVLHSLGVGGAEVLAVRLARQLGDHYRFVFACLDELGPLGEQVRSEGIPVHVLGRRAGLDGRCVWRLAQLLRREGAALVHAHQYTPYSYATAARLLCRRPPVLFTEHGRHFPDLPKRRRIWANRLLLQRRDRLVGVGQVVKNALVANEGFSPERVGVIYNGIDLTAYEGAAPDRAAIRRDMGVGPGDFVILLVARLDYLKDHATALRAFDLVRRERPDARLILVGDGPERDAVERRVADLGLGESVRLLGLRRDVPRLVRAADVFLLTSISEGIPLTVLEAMAAEVPVVATRVGGLSEVVEDGQTGLLAPAGDAASLAAHVLRLAGDPGLRGELARRGRRRVEDLFSEERMVAEYRGLYAEQVRG
jgi:L-malate glycosyltransferase